MKTSGVTRMSDKLIFDLDRADLFLRNRVQSPYAPLNKYDIAILLDIAKTCNEVARLLETQESDVAEVKHGYWITNKPNEKQMKDFHDMGIGKAMALQSIYWTCSECGTWGTPRYKYCPECGAKMDGGVE